MTDIEWTQRVWNPTTGCDRVSPGCDNCYAMTMARRLKGMGSAKYQTDGNPETSGPGFGLSVHPSALTAPFGWRNPQRVFVNSMSDLFHADVPDGFIGSVFETMASTPHHTYQILTKRPARMRSLLRRWAAEGERHDWAGPGTAVFRRDDLLWVGPIAWPLPNVWLGVSVEDQKRADLRIPALLDTPAAVRFLSCEPLLGPVDLSQWLYHGPSNYTEFGTDCDCGGTIIDNEDNCNGPKIGWVIVGGESGPGARPMDLDWAQMIVDYCVETRTRVFVKQLGSAHGAHKGGDMDTWPPELRVREYPAVTV